MCGNSKRFFVCLAVTVLSNVSSQAATSAIEYIPPTPQTTNESFESLFPVNSIASGPVHLVGQVDREGKVTDVKVLRSIVSLDEASIHAAKLWRFVPAKLNGQPQTSFFTFSFNYYVLEMTSEAKVSPFKPDSSSAVSYIPPIPASTRQPVYPENSVAMGSVIVLVDVEVDGKVSKVKILKSLTSLDETCVEAARLWRYEPAKFNGGPIKARAAICFNFDRGSGRVTSNY
jgi:TonB family protein